jgi:hypothetical protein
MKTGIKFLLATIFLVSCEQEISVHPSEIPKSVMMEFNSRYPTATDVEWKAEKENGHFYFESDFKIGGTKKAAHFNAEGRFVEEEN